MQHTACYLLTVKIGLQLSRDYTQKAQLNFLIWSSWSWRSFIWYVGQGVDRKMSRDGGQKIRPSNSTKTLCPLSNGGLAGAHWARAQGPISTKYCAKVNILRWRNTYFRKKNAYFSENFRTF